MSPDTPRELGTSLKLSFSRDMTRLRALSDELGASLGSPAEAVAFGDVVVVSLPWSVLPAALAAAGHFQNEIVVDAARVWIDDQRKPT